MMGFFYGLIVGSAICAAIWVVSGYLAYTQLSVWVFG